ncbi:hypothetical protein SAMN06296036_11585 [Pseudobacteriovorax antillogorgiicola]|uniref:Uncharacterized protein n=1 Tax=Pseudobacteriovorax antillogorgiicola TaxID=1513793 RepID=A0A1Y6CDJ3_9BACT|nr:hypothetical protein EDD56_110116 [Pseudobacteriovorax antillogorgiicola]SMF49547.1 hypothetical protein SAMN06296036_11585 [Pseudobacteriovorax antillogorgiicola]
MGSSILRVALYSIKALGSIVGLLFLFFEEYFSANNLKGGCSSDKSFTAEYLRTVGASSIATRVVFYNSFFKTLY